MSYQAGDIVYPADLPKRFPCCVEQAEQLTTSSGSVQLLRLVPLEGPWPRASSSRVFFKISPSEAAEMYSVAASHARARASSPIDA